jgi:hypothetical protein
MSRRQGMTRTSGSREATQRQTRSGASRTLPRTRRGTRTGVRLAWSATCCATWPSSQASCVLTSMNAQNRASDGPKSMHRSARAYLPSAVAVSRTSRDKPMTGHAASMPSLSRTRRATRSRAVLHCKEQDRREEILAAGTVEVGEAALHRGRSSSRADEGTPGYLDRPRARCVALRVPEVENGPGP